MTISAQIIADSISPDGVRITTMQLRYPRFIHAEFMTHRVFSRNASSSRAIPVAKMIEDLRRDPAMPVFWGSNKPGMQAGDQLSEADIEICEQYWLNGMETAIDYAQSLVDFGLHKQIANRILEPWAHINVVVTATDWENFFQLRRHKDAQPEIHELADRMYLAMHMSKPEEILSGQWHLPYVPHWERADIVQDLTGKSWDENWDKTSYEAMIKVSVARCARVSFLTHDGRKTTGVEDAALYDRLIGSIPLHASPAEHQATPLECNGSFIASDGSTKYVYKSEHLSGNFTGWCQYRKTLLGEFTPG